MTIFLPSAAQDRDQQIPSGAQNPSRLCEETHEDGNLGFPGSTGRRYLNMDEYFARGTDQSDEKVLDEGASLNGKPAVQSGTVPA